MIYIHCTFSIFLYFIAMQIQCSHRLCKRAKVPSLTFAETMETAFRFGPKAFRGWSAWTGKFVDIFVVLVQYLTTVVYALYVGRVLQKVMTLFIFVKFFIYVKFLYQICWNFVISHASSDNLFIAHRKTFFKCFLENKKMRLQVLILS